MQNKKQRKISKGQQKKANQELDDIQKSIEELENVDKKEQAIVTKLEQEIEELQVKNAELKDAYARTTADLQNFKRRTAEEKRDLTLFANTNLILEILPIIDNFERAIQHMPEVKTSEWEGILQIYDQLSKVLENQGLEEIEALGKELDPNLHEALLHSKGENGIIVQELEKGYLLKGKVIRPAKVAVGNGE